MLNDNLIDEIAAVARANPDCPIRVTSEDGRFITFRIGHEVIQDADAQNGLDVIREIVTAVLHEALNEGLVVTGTEVEEDA